VLAHGYTEIRLDQVWQAIAQDLPALKALIDDELSAADRRCSAVAFGFLYPSHPSISYGH
jgi:hypothetical protein